jgi:dTDP-4-dehydrorhamnose reductase
MAKSLISLKVQHVEPISTGAYPTPAKRPVNSVLDCSRIQKEFGIRNRPWKESLAEMLKIILDD